MQPQDYSRRILLVVTGMSPQVVTESLYALAKTEKQKYIPTEIHIITTKSGAREARLNLLSKDAGWFYRLCDDYHLPSMRLSDKTIHIITDAHGEQLDDIRTPQDNEAAADSITELVRHLTDDEQCSLHVSIAGGRKTMGYYLGYALSLYGREQDRLSHVLVSAPYESNRHFFYPTPYEMPVYVRQGEKEQTFDAKDASIELAQIPFVRLRDGLDENLKIGKTSFSKAVSQAQQALPRVSVCIELDKSLIIMGGVPVKMTPTELAFYWLLMAWKKEGKHGFHWSLDNAAEELLNYMGQVVSVHSGRYEEMEKALTVSDENGHKIKTMTKEYINPLKSNINKVIKKELGLRMAKDYLVVANGKILGTRYKYYCLPVTSNMITLPD